MITPPCAECTITARLKALNISILALVIVLIAANCGQFLALKKNLFTLRQFHGLVAGVLELGRHEENFLLTAGADSLADIRHDLERITVTVRQLEPRLRRLVPPQDYSRFIKAVQSYRLCLKSPNPPGIPSQCLRRNSKIMAKFAFAVLEREKADLASGYRTVFLTFTTGASALAILLTWFLFSQTRNLRNRIAFVRQAAGDALRGDPSPIVDIPSARDEIHGLIQAFNRLATELDHRTHELFQAEKLAALGTFSSSIAHELNNPLNNISLSADMLLQDLDQLSGDEIREILQDILAQTDRTGAIVHNLLDFSRDSREQVGQIEVRDLIEQTLRLIENELRLDHIQVKVRIPDNLPAIRGDFRRLQQVFLNLFINAVQAMPGGGRLRIDARPGEQGYIRINVSDTGGGIPPRIIDKIFDPFFTTKDAGKGTGLGLSVSRDIVRKHGGHIKVRSSPGQGTTFSVSLPAATEQRQNVPYQDDQP